ncbi:MAG: SpoIID/LytB domain-containing protein [Xylanivirga thermophila]|jgi:stage II sporulation protein D|uniref:SpoIID/LytB domain-containing protein n=1 Tax=Xylanivirga thermophila TaxID=2496273 RepID=UPI0039F510C0
MKRRRKRVVICLVIALLIISSCAYNKKPAPQKRTEPSKQNVKIPKLPPGIKGKNGEEPKLKVYIKEEGQIREMPFEQYIAGVVAGEIKNDWPEETIKAQAIIARTFVLDFIKTKGHSKYSKDAHVSTDIEEAQAWNQEGVDDKILKAVQDTRGQVIVYNGDFAKTWFHSSAAGMTADAKEGLDYKYENPPYITNVKSPDTGSAVPADERSWTATFPKSNVVSAIKKAGGTVGDFSKVGIGKKGKSGRAITLLFDNEEVAAAEFRIAIDSTVMKSTMIDSIQLQGNNIIIKGRGYGHGVGMSQWGAYYMAKEGKKAADIINYYFKGISIARIW